MGDVVKIGRTYAGRDTSYFGAGMVWLRRQLRTISSGLTTRSKVFTACSWRYCCRHAINAAPGFAEPPLLKLPSHVLAFVSAPNKFTVQGAHDALGAALRHVPARLQLALQDWQRYPLMSAVRAPASPN